MIPKEYTKEQILELEERFGGSENDLTFSFGLSNNIFGQRAIMKVHKECRNIPGFAPESYTSDVCEIVINDFKDDNFYFQFHDSPPTMYEYHWIDILARMNNVRDYIHDNFSNALEDKE